MNRVRMWKNPAVCCKKFINTRQPVLDVFLRFDSFTIIFIMKALLITVSMLLLAAGKIPVEPTGETDNTVIRINISNATAQVNWPALKQLISAAKNLKPLTGKDSVDYTGQVYYATSYKTEGFDRSAIKRIKRNGQWYYESFYKSAADSNQVRKIFFALYDGLKRGIKENTADDFILASSAKRSISENPVNWLIQWTLAKNYKTLPPGLGNIKIGLVLTGMKNAFKNNAMEYTIKLYVYENELSYDLYTWDKPL